MRSRGSHIRIGITPLALALVAQFLAGIGVGTAIVRKTEVERIVAAHVAATKPTPARAAAKPKKATPRPAPSAPAAPKPARAPAQSKPVSPIAGKGMWIYEMNKVGRTPAAIAKLAAARGYTHLFVRVGSGKRGLDTLSAVQWLIPYAHNHGIKVIAWYFPYFTDVKADVARSLRVIRHTIRGHRFDGFAADIEPAPGALVYWGTTTAYSRALWKAAGSSYLILVPPRPTTHSIRTYPYGIARFYDAIAPMVYWGRFDPDMTTAQAIRWLSRYGKDIAPIGQAYDMGPEGGPRGNPPAWETNKFMMAAKRYGAVGVSFWSWQHASGEQIRTIRAFPW